MTRSVFLRCTEGSSNKVYNIRLEAKDDGFVVNIERGRYGGTLIAETKTPTPLPLEKAEKIFSRLEAEKRGKLYTDADGGLAYVGSELAGRDTGVRVQLLNPIEDDSELEALLNDDSWWGQEKWDGERRVIAIDTDAINGVNRKGFSVPLSGEITEVVRSRISVSGRTEIDGEDFGTTFAPFDLLMLNGRDLRDLPYRERLALLEGLIADAIEMPKPMTWTTAADKRAQFARLRDDGFEGVVFKKADAPHSAGRPNSGGDQRKYKFVESATCRVIGENIGKRSVGLELLDLATAMWVFVGNVTIASNHAVPSPGQVVSVKYLYAMPGGSLIQPVYDGIRSDQDASDCVLSQLKYKQAAKHSQAA